MMWRRTFSANLKRGTLMSVVWPDLADLGQKSRGQRSKVQRWKVMMSWKLFGRLCGAYV